MSPEASDQMAREEFERGRQVGLEAASQVAFDFVSEGLHMTNRTANQVRDVIRALGAQPTGLVMVERSKLDDWSRCLAPIARSGRTSEGGEQRGNRADVEDCLAKIRALLEGGR